MLNRWEGIGNLGKDPETRYTTGSNPTAVTRFSIAVDHGYGERKKTVWVNIVTFGRLAENCQKFLNKGKKVYAAGELDIREYQKQDGSKGYITEVTARDVEFLSAQNEQIQAPAQNNWPPQTGFQQPAQQPVQPAWSQPQQEQPITYQQFKQEKAQEQMPAGFEQMAQQETIPF